MKYLIDANILSEPTKPQPSEKVEAWLKAHRRESVTCAPVIGELWRGIYSLTEGKRKESLASWFMALRLKIPSLDWTTDAAVTWAELINSIKRRGFTVGLLDTQIAAIARHHGLTVATRNVDDFSRCGVPVVNPFD
jgi:toxin FitB